MFRSQKKKFQSFSFVPIVTLHFSSKEALANSTNQENYVLLAFKRNPFFILLKVIANYPGYLRFSRGTLSIRGRLAD